MGNVPVATSTMVDNSNIIVVDDDDCNQADPTDDLAVVGNTPILGPVDIYTTTRASGIDHLCYLIYCLAGHVYNIHVFFLYACAHDTKVLFMPQCKLYEALNFVKLCTFARFTSIMRN